MYNVGPFNRPPANGNYLLDTLMYGDFTEDCVTCMLDLYTSVQSMIGDNLLPYACRGHTGFADTVCRYALSDVIVAFDKCTGSTSTSIGSKDVQLGANGCTASQIMQLDGEFNIYSTLIDKIIFDADTSDFDAAVEALPCHKVFDDWIDGFNVNVATLKGATKCGTRAGQLELQYDNGCYGIQGFTTTANNDNDLAEYFADLPILLSGGYSITTNANTRCSADEATIISQLRPFGALVKCSFANNYQNSQNDADAWNTCVNEYWPLMSSGLDALDCAACIIDTTNHIGIADVRD